MFSPFVDLVNKVRARLFASSNGGAVAGTPTLARMDKAAHERFSKTVMPNATRTISAREPLQAASTISGPAHAMTATRTGPRMISLGAQTARKTEDLPPAIALALEPKVERAISLQLSEILEKVPAGYIKSEESFDPTRRVLLKAVELEKGMASRKPSVALTSIYEQIPDIFMRSVPLTDDTRIALPFDKVLDQFNRVQIRRDQAHDMTVPQVDTPFLIVALEESEKFGTTIDPIQTSALPSVKVEHASAEAFAAAEPEALESATVPPARPPKPTISVPETRVEKTPADNTPARIPFDLPPKGTGAPASEQVPASSGPPVLSSGPVRSDSPKQAAPVKPARNPYEPVPFDQLKLSMPDTKSISESNSETASRRRKPPAEDVELAASPGTEASKSGEARIALSLRMLLQNLPAFQRKGDPNLVPENVMVEFPFAMLVEQLASGRIAVPSQVFLEAIPSEYRYLFHLDEQEAPVLLPLQEVLKNMPATALQMRSDQEKPVAAETIVTPFSMQADADAKLFKKESKEEKEDKEEAPAPAPEPVTMAAPKIEAVVERVDAKQVVSCATALPGIDGCAITFTDGLSLAGNLPLAMAADGLCAVAPTLFQRIDKHMVETKLGALESITLQGSNSAISFFMRGNICLAALHSNGALAAETRAELAKIVNELSRTYSQPEISNVDH